MTKSDYRCVLDTIHLQNGTLWPMPITLSISNDEADLIRKNDTIALIEPDKESIIGTMLELGITTGPLTHKKYLINFLQTIYLLNRLKSIGHFGVIHVNRCVRKIRAPILMKITCSSVAQNYARCFQRDASHPPNLAVRRCWIF
jgi:hypothetical protein